MEEMTNFIQNVGFPIVACVFMFKTQQELQKTITELTSTLKVIDSRIGNLEEHINKEVK